MNWYRAAALVLLVTTAACRGADTQTRTIDLAHMSSENAIMLVEPYVDGGAKYIRRTDNPSALTITAPRSKLDQIEELLRRYDVPAPEVRLHFQVIEADGFTMSDPAIADVEAALRELFRFRGYRLSADAVMTGRPFSNINQQLIGPGNVPLSISATIHQVSSVQDRKAVQLDVEMFFGSTNKVLQTGVTVPHGQTVVLGSSRPSPDVGALILVVRPEIK